MKKKTKILKLIAILTAFIGLSFTVVSCEPDEIDAFIDGFYDGYYGNY